MKISLGKFYCEVTGTKTQNRATTTAALKRWGVPFDENAPRKGDAVDISFLEPAKAAWTIEQAALAERREKRGNGHEPGGADKVVDDFVKMVENVRMRLESIDMALAVLDERSKAQEQAINAAIGPALGRIESIANATLTAASRPVKIAKRIR